MPAIIVRAMLQVRTLLMVVFFLAVVLMMFGILDQVMSRHG